MPIYERYASNILAGQIPYKDFNVEYPPLALIIFLVPGLLAKLAGGYSIFFRFFMALFDIGCLILVRAMAGNIYGDDRVKIFKISFIYLLLTGISFQFLYDRYDMAVAFLIIWSIYSIIIRGHWRVSYFVLWSAVLAKLFPIILFPIFLFSQTKHNRDIKKTVIDFAITTSIFIIIAFGASIWIGDWWVSVLSYHGSRGIQIESLYGSVILIAKLMGLPAMINHDFGAFNIASSFSPFLTAFAPFLTAAGILSAYYLYRRTLTLKKAATMEPKNLLSAVTLTLLIFVVFNKVLSPQYLIWLFPLAAITWPDRRQSSIVIGLWFCATITTAVLFPYNYPAMVMFKIEGISLQVIRNISLVALVVYYAGFLSRRTLTQEVGTGKNWPKSSKRII